jgi:hypothetical protein
VDLIWIKKVLVVTSLGFKEYSTYHQGVDLSDKLKLKTNVIYTYFNRKTLNEQGLGSVLFNALNTQRLLVHTMREW